MYFQKAKAFLMSPSQTFQNEVNVPLGEAAKYMFVLALVYTILSTIYGTIITYYAAANIPQAAYIFNPVTVAGTFIVSYVSLTVSLIFGGVILHVSAYIFGARQKIDQTMKTGFYAGTPVFLLGWIPVVNIIAWAYSIYLYVIGLMKLQQMSSGRAIAAVVFPAVVLFIIAILIMGFAFTTMMGSGFDPTSMMASLTDIF
jgi:hypothetical protein